VSRLTVGQSDVVSRSSWVHDLIFLLTFNTAVPWGARSDERKHLSLDKVTIFVRCTYLPLRQFATCLHILLFHTDGRTDRQT
jgi:hypothetical protein